MPAGAPLGNNNGGKSKFLTEAIIKALKEECNDSKGQKTKRMYMLARKLLDRAIDDGEITAIREVLDRVEGKSPQALTHANADGSNLSFQITLVKGNEQ